MNTYQQAEKLYISVLRTEPQPVSELHSTEKVCLLHDIKAMIFCDNTGTTLPQKGNESEYFFDMMDDYFYRYPIEIELKDTDLFVDLVNYKGEGIGIALFERVKHLPVFRGKYCN